MLAARSVTRAYAHRDACSSGSHNSSASTVCVRLGARHSFVQKFGESRRVIPKMPKLVQVAYYSRNVVEADEATLSASLEVILTRSRLNNLRDGLTGYLLFDRHWFVQILEGAPEHVDATIQRIKLDPRHAGLTMISRREIRARSFPEWSMGGAFVTSTNEAIFARHGIHEGFDPARLTAPGIVALAMDLQDGQRSRRSSPLQIVP